MSFARPQPPSGGRGAPTPPDAAAPRPDPPAAADAADDAARLLERVLDQTLTAADDNAGGGRGPDPRLRAALAAAARRHPVPGAGAAPPREAVADLVAAVVSARFGADAGRSPLWRRACDAVAGSLCDDPAWAERLVRLWPHLRGEP